MSDDLEQRVREFIKSKILGVRLDMPLNFDIIEDGHMFGDDLWEFVDKFSKEFRVPLSEFRWYHHSGPEGCNPLWMIIPPWWEKKSKIPIRLCDLIASAQSDKWSICYPEGEREDHG